MLADLHIHTKASDGLYTAEEICSMAVAAGITAIAITDHDTIDGFHRLKTPIAGLEVMPGVEISTYWQGQDIHMLGYNISLDKGSLGQKLYAFRNDRLHRLRKMIDKLRELGYEIEEDDAIAFAEGDSVGRPHVAQAMVAKGYFDNVKDVFDELLASGAPAFVPREKITPAEGIEAIISSGGVPVLAHPGLTPGSLELIASLVDLGLKGVEVYYPLHSKEFIDVLLKVTKIYDLLATGGSDFHGFPGDSLGKSGVDSSIVDRIKELSSN